MIVTLVAAGGGVPTGALITVGGGIIAALIAGFVALLVRITRTPIQIQDLWAENASLRNQLREIDDQVQRLIGARETQLNYNRTLGEGFDALSNYVEREAELAGRSPRFTAKEHAAIEKARALRNDEDAWAATAPTT